MARLRAALASGQLKTSTAARSGDPFIQPEGGTSDTPALIDVSDHACVFYDRQAAAHCRIQTTLGHDALPLACRQFPRVTVRDPGGISLTLSHYCPTAASMLQRDGPVWVVDNAAAFPASGEYIGLDAHDALPPLLREDVLMDWDSWWTLEALSVDLLANSPGDASHALGTLAEIINRLDTWRPADGPLLHRVRETFAHTAHTPHRLAITPADCIAAIPDDLQSSVPAASGATVDDRVLRRFLAAHAFANWAIHLGPGLRAWYRSIEAAYCLIDAGYDVRQADLILRHLADAEILANFI